MEAEVWMPPSLCASSSADPNAAPMPEEWTVRGRVRVQPLREGLRSLHGLRRYEGAEPWLAAGAAAGADDACQASFMRPRVSVGVEAVMPDGAACRPAHCVASDECDDAAADAHAASLYAVEKRTRQVQLSEGVCGGQTLRLSFSATAAAAIDSSFGTNPASSLPASPAVSKGFHLLDRPAGGGVAEGVAPRVLRPFFPPGYQRSTLVHVSVDSFVSSLHGTFGEIDPLWLGLSCYAYDAGGGGGGGGAATLLCEPYYRSYYSNVVRSAAADGTFDSRAEPSSCLLHVPHSVAASPRHKVLLVVKVYRKLTGPSSQRAQVLYDTPAAAHEAAGSRRRKKVEEELDGGIWLGRTELGWRVVALPKDDGDAINLTYLYKPVQEKKAAAATAPGAQGCWFDVPHPSQHLALVTSPACVTPPALCLHIFLRRSGARSLGLASGGAAGAQAYVQDERLDTFPFTCVMATEQVEPDQVRGCAGAGRQCRIAAGSAEVAAVAAPCLLRNDGHPVSVPPQTVRGELYVRLNSLALVKNCNLRNPGDLRTLLVEAALRTSDNLALGEDAVVSDAFLDWKGEGGRTGRHFCSISHHARACCFDEQLVVFPPREADATAAYHILFSIYHVSFKGKSPSLVPAGYAVLHLSNAAGALSVPDGEHALKVLSPSTELYTSIFERRDQGYFAAFNRPHEAGPHSSDDPKCQKLFWNAGSCGLSVTTYTNCSATSAGAEASADADTASVARLLSCLDAAAGHDGGEGATLKRAEKLLLADTGGLAPDLLAGALPAVVDRLLQTMRQASDEGTRARVAALLLAAFAKMGDGGVADNADAPQTCAPCAEEDGHDVVTCVLGTHPEKDALHGAAAWYCASVFSDEGAGGEPAWSLLLGAAAASGLAGPLAALGGCNDASPSARHGARARVLKNFFSLVLRSVLLGFHAEAVAAADTGDHSEAFRTYAAEQGLVDKLRACFAGCGAGLVSGAGKDAETEEEEAEEEKGAEEAAGVVTAVGVVFGLFLADLSPLLRVDEVAYILNLQISTAEAGDEGSAAAAAAAASGRALLDAGAASGFLNRVPRFLPFLPAFAGHMSRLLRVQLAVRAAEAAQYRAARGGVDADRRYFRLFLRHRRPVVAAARVVAEVVALARGATSCCGPQREAALRGVLRGGCAGEEVSGVWRWYVEAVAVGEVCIARSIARHAEQVARMQAYARRGGGGGSGDEAALLAATVCAKQAYLAKEEETLADHHARCRRTLRLLAGLAATAARHAAPPPMPLLLSLPSVVDALRTDGCAQRRSAQPLQDLCRLLDGGDVAPWPWACGALAEPRSPHPPAAPVLSFLYLASAAAADSALAALEREVAPTRGGDGDARRLLCMRVLCGVCDGVADALRTNPLEYPEAVWRAAGRLAEGVREGTLARRAVGASLAVAGFAGAADEAAAAAVAQCDGAQPQEAACVFSAACATLLAAHAAGRRVGVAAGPGEACAVIVGNGAGEAGPAAAAAGIKEMVSLLAQAPALAAPVPVVRLLLRHGAADVAFGFVRHAIEGCSGRAALTLHTVAALLSLVLAATCEATHPCWGCFRELSDTCEGLCDEALVCCPATLRCGLAARFEMSIAEPSLPPTPPLVEVEASTYTAYACEHLLEVRSRTPFLLSQTHSNTGSSHRRVAVCNRSCASGFKEPASSSCAAQRLTLASAEQRRCFDMQSRDSRCDNFTVTTWEVTSSCTPVKQIAKHPANKSATFFYFFVTPASHLTTSLRISSRR